MLLFLSFIAFAASLIGMAMMIYRAFPRLVDIAVVEHRAFPLFGIENVHILEYKEPAEVFWKKLFISLEKILRRVRGWVLKLDTTLSRLIEFVQKKNQAAILPRREDALVTRTPSLPEEVPHILPPAIRMTGTEERTGATEPENLIVIREKPKAPLRQRRIVRDIATNATGNIKPNGTITRSVIDRRHKE